MAEDGSGRDEQQIRAAKNEALFREVNERIMKLGDTATLELLNFVCECADLACAVLIPLSSAEYRETRIDPRHFVVQPSHVRKAAERVVLATDRYVIVEKVGLAGEIAEAEAP